MAFTVNEWNLSKFVDDDELIFRNSVPKSVSKTPFSRELFYQ